MYTSCNVVLSPPMGRHWELATAVKEFYQNKCEKCIYQLSMGFVTLSSIRSKDKLSQGGRRKTSGEEYQMLQNILKSDRSEKLYTFTIVWFSLCDIFTYVLSLKIGIVSQNPMKVRCEVFVLLTFVVYTSHTDDITFTTSARDKDKHGHYQDMILLMGLNMTC